VTATVGTNYGNSSLHDGVWVYTLSYDYKKSTSSGTTGGSGSRTDATASEAFTVASPIERQMEELTDRTGTVHLTPELENGFDIQFTAADGEGCRYTSFTTDDTSYLSEPTVASTANLSYRVRLPDLAEDMRLDCRYRLVADNGYAQNLTVTVAAQTLQDRQTTWTTRIAEFLETPAFAPLNAETICTDLGAARRGADCGQHMSLDGVKVWHLTGLAGLLLSGGLALIAVRRGIVAGAVIRRRFR
jgi:hypothetical protein